MNNDKKEKNDALKAYRYAHRGLHNKPEIPENSMIAFKRAKENGYGIELDIHLMKDGNLAVIHDSSLSRTAGDERFIEDLTMEDLEDTRLEGTNERIPAFKDVLDLFNGEYPIIVELKAERGNHADLCKKACELLDSYTGLYCIESFDPRCILWLAKNRPDIVRGQLVSNFIKKSENLSLITRLLLTSMVMNVVTKPDFIACKFEDRKMFSNWFSLKIMKRQGYSWTIRSYDDLLITESEGNIPIFEQFMIK